MKNNKGEISEKSDIEAALRSSWFITNNDISVSVAGYTATLTGTVNSSYQKEEAARIAFNVAGVWSVENEIIVDFDYGKLY